jgi:hypothetical protein
MNAEFTMIGFNNYTDQELEAIDQKRTNRLGYKTSDYKTYEQPRPVDNLESRQQELQKEVSDKMIASGGNHTYYWERWYVNTGAGALKTPEDVIDRRISQRQAIIDFMVELGANPERFNNVSLEDLRKMAKRAGA